MQSHADKSTSNWCIQKCRFIDNWCLLSQQTTIKCVFKAIIMSEFKYGKAILKKNILAYLASVTDEQAVSQSEARNAKSYQIVTYM